jgi:hypothetical protein
MLSKDKMRIYQRERRERLKKGRPLTVLERVKDLEERVGKLEDRGKEDDLCFLK